mgnify:CR=1 FL=1
MRKASPPNIFISHPSFPPRTIQELVHTAKNEPGKINFGTGGVGTGMHLAAVLFQARAGIRMNHVPYKGAGPALTDLIGGQVHMLITGYPGALPHIKAGRLRALGVTGAKRLPAAPDLPTIGEQGFPGFRAWSASR